MPPTPARLEYDEVSTFHLPLCGGIGGQQTCEDRRRAWQGRIQRAFLATHPGLDSLTRQYVESGAVAPALDAATVVEQVKQAEAEAQRQERARVEAQRAAQDAQIRANAQARKELEGRAYVVASTARAGYTIGCGDPITLQTVLEYRRVGDDEHFRDLVGAGFDRHPCQILPKGQIVVPLVQQAEYWQVGVAAGDFPLPISFWVPASDLTKMPKQP